MRGSVKQASYPLDDWADRVERELITAHGRSVRYGRRRRGLASLGVVASLALAGGAVMVLAPALFAPTVVDAFPVEIDRIGDEVTVSLVEYDSDPIEVIDTLRGFGMQVRVREATTGPSLAGRVLGFSDERPQASALATTRMRVPHSTQSVTVHVGVLAERGLYEHPTDPFAPGEPLQDLAGDTDLTISKVVAAAEAAQIAVTWIDGDGNPTRERPDSDELVLAVMLSRDLMLVRAG